MLFIIKDVIIVIVLGCCCRCWLSYFALFALCISKLSAEKREYQKGKKNLELGSRRMRFKYSIPCNSRQAVSNSRRCLWLSRVFGVRNVCHCQCSLVEIFGMNVFNANWTFLRPRQCFIPSFLVLFHRSRARFHRFLLIFCVFSQRPLLKSDNHPLGLSVTHQTGRLISQAERVNSGILSIKTVTI